MSDSCASSPRIVVLGGGIAGTEAALTLAAGCADAHVTLVGRWPSVRLLPDLVYVPFGISARRIDLPLADLLPHGVHAHVADVIAVDAERRFVTTTTGTIAADIIIAAPGAMERERSGHGLRTLDDALRLRGELARAVDAARNGRRQQITVQTGMDDSWTAPACELAILMGAWLRAQRLDRSIEVLLATADREVFEWFGTAGNDAVEAAMRRSRVRVATGVPLGRFDELGGDVVVEFGPLRARSIVGLPGLGANGWYGSGTSFEVAPGVFVIGDATSMPYRAGFATAWQARAVLRALDGNPSRLGLEVDGIPSDSVEYQMDLADGVMHARIPVASSLAHPFLGHDAEIDVRAGSHPDKLAGLLLHERILRWAPRVHDAPLALRDALRQLHAA
jgi:hypothetical protein